MCSYKPKQLCFFPDGDVKLDVHMALFHTMEVKKTTGRQAPEKSLTTSSSWYC